MQHLQQSVAPRAVTTRYQEPHLRDLCKSICCSTCPCRCHCLDPAYKPEIRDPLDTVTCMRCRGWTHYGCERSVLCADCRNYFCFGCDVLSQCAGCDHTVCTDFQDPSEEGQFACFDCRDKAYKSESCNGVGILCDSDFDDRGEDDFYASS
jgi:hypothetical protein